MIFRIPGLLIGLALAAAPVLANDLPERPRAVLNRQRVPDADVSVIVRDVVSGESLVQLNAELPRPPASTMKLLPTWAALDLLGPAYKCLINKGWGIMDFLEEINMIRPDIFIVNEDGNTPAKAALCEELGIEFIVSKRIPHEGLPARSTTSLRTECRIHYRIDLAGGWLDQPFVSQYYPGPVITMSIEPTLEFNYRKRAFGQPSPSTGMARLRRGRQRPTGRTDYKATVSTPIPDGERDGS